MKRIAAFAFAIAAAVASGETRLPGALTAEAPGLQRFSETSFRKLFWHVYDASLWIPGERWAAEAPYALEIRYAIAVTGRDLAHRSVEEMRRQGHSEAQLAAWEREMVRVFPDIQPGDRLVGLAMPKRGARFYTGDRMLGTIEDERFATAFFGIWLDARTSEPQLRRALLKLP